MNRVVFDDRWQFSGFRTAILANKWMRIVVLPELGGKIWSVEHRRSAHEWLWHNPRIGVARAPFGSSFDDNWSGGADVAFPSCYECRWGDWKVPDLGEFWSIPWEAKYHEDAEGVVLVLTASGRVWPVDVVRTIRMDHQRPVVTMGFHITNVSFEAIPFVMGFHPALAIEPGYRIDLPQGTVRIDEGTETMGVVGQEYIWPLLPTHAGHRDMRVVPPQSNAEFGGHFFSPKGPDLWWSVVNPDLRIGIGLVASRAQFRGLWLWQVYGGWRGYYHLALEPWTGYPIRLDKAVEAGGAEWLGSGYTYDAELKITCFEGLDNVTRMDSDGTVFSG